MTRVTEAGPPAGAVVVGEALVDIVVEGGVETGRHPGGSCANVAVALARLGRPTTLVTSLGDDEPGRRIRHHLAASGVDVEAQRRVRTATARAVIGETGAATYEIDLDWSLDAEAVTLTPAVVHVGSIAAVLEPGAAAVRELVASWREQAYVSYDVNARPALTPDVAGTRAEVERMIALSDLVKASDEDIAFLHPGRPVAEVAERWLELGASAVAVTMGGAGSEGYTVAGSVRVAAPRVVVADTIGAGDTYSAALIDALWDVLTTPPTDRRLSDPSADRWQAALAHAARAAAVTVTRAGADPPWRDELVPPAS